MSRLTFRLAGSFGPKLITTLLLACVVWLFSITLQGDPGYDVRILQTAVCCLLVGTLLYPPADNSLSAALHGLLIALVFLGAGWLQAEEFQASLLFTAVILAAISGCAASLELLLRKIPTSVDYSSLIVLVILIISGSSPVWAGVLIELANAPEGLTQAAVTLSPLSHLAVGLEMDYLRTEWIYRVTPIGSLRYSYPGPVLVILGYLCLMLLIHLGTRFATEKSNRGGSQS